MVVPPCLSLFYKFVKGINLITYIFLNPFISSYKQLIGKSLMDLKNQKDKNKYFFRIWLLYKCEWKYALYTVVVSHYVE
jgi:hypothetical protein